MNVATRRIFFTCLSLATFLVADRLPAAIIATIQDASIVEGGSGFFDVFIEGSGEGVQAFDFQLQISPVGAVTSQLRFSLVQSEAHLFDPMISGDYLFSGNSEDVSLPLPFGTVSTTILDQDTLFGSDATADGLDTSIQLPRLLGRFEIESIVPLNTSLGVTERFEVLLDLNFIDSNFQLFPVVSNVGFIDVTAVPEPSSIALLSLAVASVVFRFRHLRIIGIRCFFDRRYRH